MALECVYVDSVKMGIQHVQDVASSSPHSGSAHMPIDDWSYLQPAAWEVDWNSPWLASMLNLDVENGLD
jgi:hypothetical protein